jgi:hypothetical protein
MAEGNIPQWTGNHYVAVAALGVSDVKTGDAAIFYLSEMSVAVN